MNDVVNLVIFYKVSIFLLVYNVELLITTREVKLLVHYVGGNHIFST